MTLPNAIITPTRAAPDIPPLKVVVDESGAENTNDSTPVSLTGRLSDWSSADGRTPAQLWDEVCRLARERQPVRLLTTTTEVSYPEMLISYSKLHRGIRFTLELVPINRVGMTDADLLPENVSGPAVNRTSEVTRGRVVLPPVE